MNHLQQMNDIANKVKAFADNPPLGKEKLVQRYARSISLRIEAQQQVHILQKQLQEANAHLQRRLGSESELFEFIADELDIVMPNDQE